MVPVCTWGKGQPTPRSKTPEGRRQAGLGLAGSRWQKHELDGSNWYTELGMRFKLVVVSQTLTIQNHQLPIPSH